MAALRPAAQGLGRPLIYLTGHIGPEVREHRDHPLLGVMLNPGNGYAVQIKDWHSYGADNGCFAQGDGFKPDPWIEWAAALPHKDRCLFAVAPDKLADPAATRRRSAPFLPILRALGYRAAFVAQDGEEAPPWEDFDCLFMGGTDAWKLSEPAFALARAARARGKWTHCGRINSWRRIRAVAFGGYDSADGTYLRFGPAVLLPNMLGWLWRLEHEPFLPLTEDSPAGA